MIILLTSDAPITLLKELQPYATIVAALGSVSTLGFILSLAKTMSDAAKERAAVLEERIKAGAEELARNEKWDGREKAELQKEIDQLKASLSNAGVTTSLEAKDVAAHLSVELRNTINTNLSEVRQLLAKSLEAGERLEPSAALQIGRGYAATGQWDLAGRFLKDYLSAEPQDWEAQVALGVSLANSKGGRNANLLALRAYNESLAFGMEPDSGMRQEQKSRVFIYRGAILKRLGRLDEAERDVTLGESLAVGEYEMADAAYNLASIYALNGNKQALLMTLKRANGLGRRDYVYRAVTGHINGYFEKFSRDAEVLSAISDLSK